MNERINELFEQALDQAVPETWTTLNPAQLSKLKEKFAELIVKECIRQVEEQYLPVLEDTDAMLNKHWVGYVQCGVDSCVVIKKHFGVEE